MAFQGRTLREWTAKMDFFASFFEYRRGEHAAVDDYRKVRKT
jgi:hypothetical protein